MIVGIVALIIVSLLAVYIIKTYNTFITLGERVKNGKAQIATQIESRFDAVNSLISATKRYEQYEAETLEKIVNQRVSMPQDASIEKMEHDNHELNNIVGRLIAVSESYPDLKASEVYVQAMENIDKYENNVRHARMMYNDVVTKFNRMVRMFPSSMIANLFTLKQKQYFEGTDTKQDVPDWN